MVVLHQTRISCAQRWGEEMVDTFEIDSDAKLVECKDEKVPVDTTKVLVYVDHENKVVYLWRGKKASLFKKLMGTRVAAKLSDTYRSYRIRPITEGHEPAAFHDLVGTPKEERQKTTNKHIVVYVVSYWVVVLRYDSRAYLQSIRNIDKGLRSRDAILKRMSLERWDTISELSAGISLSYATIRYHLCNLEGEGFVERNTEMGAWRLLDYPQGKLQDFIKMRKPRAKKRSLVEKE